MYAVDHLSMTVSQGAIYGFIGENGSGKSTTEKLICGHLVPDSGEIKLFGKDYTDPGVRIRVGVLIENAGCFLGSSVYQNLMMQCINLGIKNADEEICRVFETVRMEDNASLKFNCSRRCIVRIWSWRNQQSGSQKDKLSIIYRATLKIGVAFSKIDTFENLCCSDQTEKMLKYIEDFFKKGENANKTLTFLCYTILKNQ
ncbi:MAG: ATP-binding cassette domain-containing protein [Clostridia bacterium]|nr:ATP-binding cassette domain-containing protein [Clostridia bacterium]